MPNLTPALQKVLEIVEPLLESNHWVRIATFTDRVFFEAGTIHSNGFEEYPSESGIVTASGRVIRGEHRI